jgi:hypothetical protein
MSTVTSHSRIQVTVEIDGSSYGHDWKLSDLVKQSSEEAITHLCNKLKDTNLRIIGTPKVLCVTNIQKP